MVTLDSTVSQRCTFFRVERQHKESFIRERERDEKNRESVLRLEIEIFAAVPSAAAEARARRKRTRETLQDLSLYIVPCNYNLYLLVIDTFTGRLLLLLVASVRVKLKF